MEKEQVEKINAVKNKVAKSLDHNNMGLPAKRIIACFIDMVMITVPFAFLSAFFSLPFFPLPGFIKVIITSAMMLAAGACVLLKDGPYEVAVVGLAKQSIGKKALGLRVTKLDGTTSPTWKESIQRNFPLAIPYCLSALVLLINIIPIPLITWLMNLILGVSIFIVSLGIAGFEAYNLFKDPDVLRWGDRQAGTMVMLD